MRFQVTHRARIYPGLPECRLDQLGFALPG